MSIIEYICQYCIPEKCCPCFIFALWSKLNSKLGYLNYIQANSENCGPPLGNKFDLEEGQRSPSRSRHGTTGKVLSQGTHMPSIKALSVIVQKLWPRLKFL